MIIIYVFALLSFIAIVYLMLLLRFIVVDVYQLQVPHTKHRHCRTPISAISCCTIDRQPTGKRPTDHLSVVFLWNILEYGGYFFTIGFFIKFCSTTEIAQRIWQLFSVVFFIGDVFTSCNLRADYLAGGLVGWLAIWRQVLLPIRGTRCLQHKL